MGLVFVPFLYFTWLFIHMYRKQRSFNAGSFVTVVYAFSALFSIIYVYTTDDHTWQNAGWDNLLPTFLYCSLLTICIMPIYRFRSDKIVNVFLKNENIQIYYSICWVLIVLTLISIITSLSSIIESLTSNLYLVRNQFYTMSADAAYTRGGQAFYQYFLNIGIAMSPIALLFFFYNTLYHSEKKVMNISLLIASLAQPITSFTLASRNQVIFWLMTFLALYVTFRHQMNKKTRGMFNRVLIVFGGLGVLYLGTVTVARFTLANTSVGNVQSSLIAYIGFPYEQFCNVFNAFRFDGLTFDRTFPIITKYILGHDFNLYDYRMMVSERIGLFVGTFYTFLGDALIDYGKLGMVIYAIFTSIMEKIALRHSPKETVSLSRMIVYVLVLRIPLLGLFAYMYLTVGSSLMVIASLMIAFILSCKFKRDYRKF